MTSQSNYVWHEFCDPLAAFSTAAFPVVELLLAALPFRGWEAAQEVCPSYLCLCLNSGRDGWGKPCSIDGLAFVPPPEGGGDSISELWVCGGVLQLLLDPFKGFFEPCSGLTSMAPEDVLNRFVGRRASWALGVILVFPGYEGSANSTVCRCYLRYPESFGLSEPSHGLCRGIPVD